MTLGKKHGWLLLALLTWTVTTSMFSMPGHAMAANLLKAPGQQKASNQPMACDIQAQVMMNSTCDPFSQVGGAACCLPNSCPGLMMIGPALMQVAASRVSAPSFLLSFSFPDFPAERLYRPPRL